MYCLILSPFKLVSACKFVPVYYWLHQYAWYLAVILPPVDVRATQSSSSAPVEVSWSPPSDQGAFNITGYRLFYGSGQNISIPSVIITSVSLKVNEGYGGKTVFLHSESGRICSERINVTVGKFKFIVLLLPLCNSFTSTETDMAMHPCRCLREIGIALGVLLCLVVMAITTVVMLWWWR